MSDSPPSQDPWTAVGRIGGGVITYGGAGFLLDLWWGTSFMVGLGIVLGAALGVYTIVVSLKQ